MTTELVHDSQTRKTIKVEIEGEAIKKVYNKISQQFARIATVQGFRPGNAPIGIVQTRYKDEIQNEVLKEILPKKVGAAITEHNLDVISEPEIHIENVETMNLNGSESVQLHVHVEVLPQVALGQYKGLEIVQRKRPVNDEAVNAVIESLRESYASLEPVEDRPAEIGDTVTVNLLGKFLDDPEAEPIDIEDVDVELGEESVEKSFTENLIGVREDDEKTFVTEYAEDFTSPGLAGKKVEYTAKVIAVRIKTLPEVDDEWARSLDEEVDSVEKLRERITNNLTTQSNYEADLKLRTEVLSKLIDAHEFEVPDSLVEKQMQQIFESHTRNMFNQGIDPRTLPQEFWDKVGPIFEKQAIRDLRGSFLLMAIADAENIKATQEEIDEEIQLIAEMTNQSVVDVRATLTKENRERSIAESLRNRKAFDFLVENANITEGEWRDEGEEGFGHAAEAAKETEASATETLTEPETADAVSVETQTNSSEEVSIK
jgi:trigger factor